MKLLLGIFFIPLLASSMRSAEYRDVPSIERPWVITPRSKLPVGVSPTDPTDPERAAESVRVWHVDVDADGHSDMIVQGIGGGTGGPFARIYRKEKAGFREVHSTQGWLSPLGIVDGTPRQDRWGKSGGGEYSVTRLRWEKHRFVEEHTDWLMQDDECRLRITHRTYPKTAPNQSPKPTFGLRPAAAHL